MVVDKKIRSPGVSWITDVRQHARHYIIKLYAQASCKKRLFILSKSLRWGSLVRRWCRMKEKTRYHEFTTSLPTACCNAASYWRHAGAWPSFGDEKDTDTIRCGRASGSAFDQQGWGAVGAVIGGGAEGAGETKRVRWSWGCGSEGGEEWDEVEEAGVDFIELLSFRMGLKLCFALNV